MVITHSSQEEGTCCAMMVAGGIQGSMGVSHEAEVEGLLSRAFLVVFMWRNGWGKASRLKIG